MSTLPQKPIEAALPPEAINKDAAREKSIRHGHPCGLHLCWARAWAKTKLAWERKK